MVGGLVTKFFLGLSSRNPWACSLGTGITELPDNTFLSLFLESDILVQFRGTLNLRKNKKADQ